MRTEKNELSLLGFRALSSKRASCVFRWALAALACLTAFSLSLGFVSPAVAQSTAWGGNGLNIKTVAIVNDEAITNLDLLARQAFMKLAGDIDEATPEAEKFRLSLEQLIEERIRIQEARKGGVVLTETDLMARAEALAKRQKKTVEQYLVDLEKQGVPRSTFLEKIRAQDVWQKLIVKKLPSAGVINPSDLDEEIKAQKARTGEIEVRVAEIFLSTLGQDKDQVALNVNTLLELMKSGETFDSLAKQYSQAPSQAEDGLRDWAPIEDFEPALQKVFATTEVQNKPLVIDGETGVWIIALLGKRKVGQKKAKTLMDIKQLFLKLPQNIQNVEAQRKLAVAAQVTQSVQGCSNFNDAMISFGDQGSGDLNQIDISTLPAQVAQILGRIDIGRPTPPLPVPNGASIFMVCSKNDQFETVEDAEIRRSIIASKAERFAERYYREIRRKAFIELLGS